MANTRTEIEMEGFPWGGKSYLITSEDSNNVYATFEPAKQAATIVKLTLQRAVRETWQDVASKSGESWNDYTSKENFNARFTNVPRTGQGMRVKVDLYDIYDSNQTDRMLSDIGDIWIR
ncbi:hypothetical protein [Bacillus sp. BP-3]|uniref:hypothetical protein n=1 Tax=Bacillus sp. BP-3 TaxID=3022773 RepID=UPI002331238E|nr:hypothetical protein [Bacillus sp. BP-3]MDC2865373.1 hypothetical protein [Bacillus sp. BP-3]